MNTYGDAARTYAQEARGYYASSPDYARIFNEIQSTTDGLFGDTMEAQAEALTKVDQSFTALDGTLGSLHSALDGLDGVMGNLDRRFAEALKPYFDAQLEATRALLAQQTAASNAEIDALNAAREEARVNAATVAQAEIDAAREAAAHQRFWETSATTNLYPDGRPAHLMPGSDG